MTADKAPVADAKSHKHHTQVLPTDDTNLHALATNVSKAWLANPNITMVWTTQAAFAEVCDQFGSSLDERMMTGNHRPAITLDLRLLDAAINQSKEYIKVYLKDKFGKDNYTSYLPQFGIVLRHNKWDFPRDRDSRREALKLTVGAIAKLGLQDKTYGLAYWQDLLSRYEALLKLSQSTDGHVSALVGTKNEYRREVRKTLYALIHILKGNYPDTYAAVLRVWGFQKEKY